MENKFYTIDQVAEILDIHHKTVRKFIKEGKLKANKVGKQWRISQIDLEVFTENKNSAIDNKGLIFDEEIEFLSDDDKLEINNEIRVSSVVDLNNINKEAYLRVSNMLLAIMNCKDVRLHRQTLNLKYNENTNRLRIMIWANIEETKELLDEIASLVEEDKDGGE